MRVDDKRYNGQAVDVPVFNIPRVEQETTVNITRDGVQVYSSLTTDITRILQVAEDVEVLSVGSNGNITSLKATLNRNQVGFRQGNKSKDM